jgi:D-sedoheptulose 7-phosphate isomerase
MTGSGAAGNGGPGGAMESLYPFLYAGATHSGAGDLDRVLGEVRRSTVEKVTEVGALRERALHRYQDQLTACAAAMRLRFADGGRLFAFGNGGSSTDALDLAALFLDPPGDAQPLPATSLAGDVAVLTALANDVGFDVVYARQLAAFARPADIAVGLSTSGNSENLLRGFAEARRRGLLTIGLAGYDGGKMAEADTIDYLFVVSSSSVHRIQEVQTTLYHVLWELTRDVPGRSVPAPGADDGPADWLPER